MNAFISQGQCRVCGQIFCCNDHRTDHENSKHPKYAYQLRSLPVVCRRCHRKLNTIYELSTNCSPCLPHIISSMKNNVSDENMNRKRILKSYSENISQKIKGTAERKKLSPLYKNEKDESLVNSPHFSNLVLINLSTMKITESFNFVFSPPFPYKSSPGVKSSTPLTDEVKENISPFVGSTIIQESSNMTSNSSSQLVKPDFKTESISPVFNIDSFIKQKSSSLTPNASSLLVKAKSIKTESISPLLVASVENSMNQTNSNGTQSTSSSLLVSTNIKKSSIDEVNDNTTPDSSSLLAQINSKTNLTPYSRMTINFSERKSKVTSKIRKVTFESYTSSPELTESSIYSTPIQMSTIVVQEECVNLFEISLTQEQQTCLLTRIAKKMRSMIHAIPKTVSNAWDWSQRRIRKRKYEMCVDVELRSPTAKRAKITTLRRKPIWANSLIRQPLWSYKQSDMI